MNQCISIAKKLDVFFHVLQTAVRIAFVGCLVGLGILLAAFVFKLEPDMVASGYTSLELGFMEFELADSVSPDRYRVLMIAGVNLVMALILATGTGYGVKQIREILSPMKEGKPFHSSICGNLKKLAVLSLALGVAVNVIHSISLAMILNTYDVVELFVSDTVTHVTANFEFDLTFVAISAVLLLLSYIFRYGEELQTLSDETL